MCNSEAVNPLHEIAEVTYLISAHPRIEISKVPYIPIDPRELQRVSKDSRFHSSAKSSSSFITSSLSLDAYVD